MRISMKKYRIISAVLAGVTALFMTGCMRMAIDVELKKDGTADVNFITAIEAQYGDLGDDDSDSDQKHYTFDGKDYIGSEEHEKLQSFEELSDYLTEMDEDGYCIFNTADIRLKKGIFTNKYIFDVTTPCLMDDAKKDSDYKDYAQQMTDILIMTISVKMPGKIGNVTGGTVNGDKVDFLFDLAKENHFHAESSEVKVVNVLIFVALLLGGAAFILIRAKKRSEVPAGLDYNGYGAQDGYQQTGFDQNGLTQNGFNVQEQKNNFGQNGQNGQDNDFWNNNGQ